MKKLNMQYMLISTLSKSKWPMVESNHIYLFELNTIGGHLYRGINLYHRNPPSPPSLGKLLLNRLDAVTTAVKRLNRYLCLLLLGFHLPIRENWAKMYKSVSQHNYLSILRSRNKAGCNGESVELQGP